MVTSSGGTKNTETLFTGDKVYVYDINGSIYGTFDIVIRGDVSGDGKINTADMILVRNHIIGTNTMSGCRTYAADSNKDGKINTADMITIRITSSVCLLLLNNEVLHEKNIQAFYCIINNLLCTGLLHTICRTGIKFDGHLWRNSITG